MLFDAIWAPDGKCRLKKSKNSRHQVFQSQNSNKPAYLSFQNHPTSYAGE